MCMCKPSEVKQVTWSPACLTYQLSILFNLTQMKICDHKLHHYKVMRMCTQKKAWIGPMINSSTWCSLSSCLWRKNLLLEYTTPLIQYLWFPINYFWLFTKLKVHLEGTKTSDYWRHWKKWAAVLKAILEDKFTDLKMMHRLTCTHTITNQQRTPQYTKWLQIKTNLFLLHCQEHSKSIK
jgi:hypothetical protein